MTDPIVTRSFTRYEAHIGPRLEYMMGASSKDYAQIRACSDVSLADALDIACAALKQHTNFKVGQHYDLRITESEVVEAVRGIRKEG